MFIVNFLNIHKRRKNNITPHTYHLDAKIIAMFTLLPPCLSSFPSFLHPFSLPPPSFVVTAVIASAAEVFQSKPWPHIISPLSTSHARWYSDLWVTLVLVLLIRRTIQRKMLQGERGLELGVQVLAPVLTCWGCSQPETQFL